MDMRAKRRWAALAVTVGLLAGSLGGGIALGASSSGDAMKRDDAMQQSSKSGDAMQEQGAAMDGAAMSAAHMTG
jgi:hypothetical protein